MRAPHRTDPVVNGEQRVRIGGDVENGEVVDRERPGEAGERDEIESEEDPRGARCERHPPGFARCRAREGRHGQHEGRDQREDERKVPELGNHGSRPPSFVRASDSATAGGM